MSLIFFPLLGYVIYLFVLALFSGDIEKSILLFFFPILPAFIGIYVGVSELYSVESEYVIFANQEYFNDDVSFVRSCKNIGYDRYNSVSSDTDLEYYNICFKKPNSPIINSVNALRSPFHYDLLSPTLVVPCTNK